MNYNSAKARGRDYSAPLKSVLPAILTRSKSIVQIAKSAGRSRQTVSKVIARLHEQGAVHIKRWQRGKDGPYAACYLWGSGDDAPKPAAIPLSERVRRYRQTEKGRAAAARSRKRWKASEQGLDYAIQYNKGRWARDKFEKGGVAAIDPLLAAMLGQSAARCAP